jgi:hypothetical protein
MDSLFPFHTAKLGSVISVRFGESFSQITKNYMKVDDILWVEVLNDGYDRGNQRFIIPETGDFVEQQYLQSVCQEDNSIEILAGITIGECIKNSIQVYALPDGAILENPNRVEKTIVLKKNGKFIVQVGKDMDGRSLAGTELPGWSLTPENASWTHTLSKSSRSEMSPA